MTSMADLEKDFEKKLGAGYARGDQFEPVERIPSGLFPLDLAIGGGFPRGRVSEIYGPEGTGKTNICLKTIASSQRLWPDKHNVFIDVEGTWDPSWASALGVDVSKVIVVTPDYSEQVANVMYELLEVDDLSCVVLDSLAAMSATKEIETEAEKSMMGVGSQAIGRMCQKLNVRLKERRDGGMKTAILFVNQTRYKLGVVMGNPETTPGGQRPKFLYSLRLRVWGKNIEDKTVSTMLPVAKDISFKVNKYKVACTATAGEFTLVTQPWRGLNIGDCDDWKVAEAFLSEMGLFGKAPGGKEWQLFGELYSTKKAIVEKYRTDLELRQDIQNTITAAAIEKTGFIQQAGGPAAAE